MSMKAEKMSIHRLKGDTDSWAASCHNFMTTMYSNCVPKDHGDMDILSYLRRADPAAVDAGKAMKDAVFAKLDRGILKAPEGRPRKNTPEKN
jgi:hypothetical protein